jgi:expansin (peptidoglycan-binding protein)
VILRQTWWAAAVLLACGGGSTGDAGGSAPPATGATATYGAAHTGHFWLGPVDFAETEWHNACAPAGGYLPSLRNATGLGGEYLAGLANPVAGAGATCDACILIEAANGRSVVARVVTYGVEQAAGDIDVSQPVLDSLAEGYPPDMTWRLAKCPDTGALEYEFKSGSNPFWTALWVRNPRVPISKVEVQVAGQGAFTTLQRETDGSLVAEHGFGSGAFTLRVTAFDDQVITQAFPSFSAGQVVGSGQQFR